MNQDGNAFRKDFICHFEDSSNYAPEGEGWFEMLQRLTNEARRRELADGDQWYEIQGDRAAWGDK